MSALIVAGLVAETTVIDLSCGPGFFAIPAAGIVGSTGHVYVVDAWEGMVEHLRSKTYRRQNMNISFMLSREPHVTLPGRAAVLVFIAVVLHEVEEPAAFLDEAGRLLTPDGAITILDCHKRDDQADSPPMTLVCQWTNSRTWPEALDCRSSRHVTFLTCTVR